MMLIRCHSSQDADQTGSFLPPDLVMLLFFQSVSSLTLLSRCFRMSGSKKRSGFQITSVTSDINHTPGKQVPPSALLSIVQAAVSSGSSSQPTTPTPKRKLTSHDTSGHGAGCSRFRVVRLAVGGAGGNRRGEPYCRGRWTCTDFLELKEGTRFKRLMDTMRHAHSLDSLEMIGREAESGRDPTHRHTNPIRGRDGQGLTLYSGPPSPTHQEPISLHLLHSREETGSPPLLPAPRPRILPPPLRLDVDASGRVQTWACAIATLSNAGKSFYNFRNIKNCLHNAYNPPWMYTASNTAMYLTNKLWHLCNTRATSRWLHDTPFGR